MSKYQNFSNLVRPHNCVGALLIILLLASRARQDVNFTIPIGTDNLDILLLTYRKNHLMF